MRTTITLDEDVAAALKQIMRERDITFKEAVNSVLRSGLGATVRGEPYQVPSRPLGVRAGIDLDRAGRLAAALEDDEIVRKLDIGK